MDKMDRANFKGVSQKKIKRKKDGRRSKTY